MTAADQNQSTAGGRAALEQEIICIEKAMFAAIKAKDTQVMSQLLADDFLLRVPGSTAANKAAFLEGIKAIPVEIADVWSEDMAVNVYGEVAVLTGTQLARTRDGSGKEEVSAQAFTDVFAKRNGRWQMVLAHSVEIPPPAKTLNT